MKMNYMLVLAGAMACSGVVRAQDIEKEFDAFARQQQQAFDDFKNKADAEFDTFLRETWKQYEAFAPVAPPARPKPVKPVQYTKPKKELPPMTVKPVAPRLPQAAPHRPEPVPVPVVKPRPGVVVERTPVVFYNTPLAIAAEVLADFKLGGNRERDVADAWKYLCSQEYEQLVQDCLRLKEERKLSDWAYLLFTKQIGIQLLGAERTNEIAFLQMFLLNQSGYKTRLAKIDDELKLLIAPTSVIYAAPYLTFGNEKYYVFEPRPGGSTSIFTYRQNFAEAKNLVNLQIGAEPELDVQAYERTLTTEDGKTKVQIAVNRNLIDFYRDYPQCEVWLHYEAPMSRELRTALYAQLEPLVAGKSQREAANLLLNFVQTAFDYATDGEQFGYEKPFFPDETFFYPYCDCEDRAMLFSTLMKELLGVDAVLLDYPNHIASAARFAEEIPGEYVQLSDGNKYLICDPTYIGAPIGACMEQYMHVSPSIIK
jgi:hypothetical protein